MTDFEPWHLPHMSNHPNDSGMCQAEGFGCVVDGRPVFEMACAEPEPNIGKGGSSIEQTGRASQKVDAESRGGEWQQQSGVDVDHRPLWGTVIKAGH